MSVTFCVEDLAALDICVTKSSDRGLFGLNYISDDGFRLFI